MSVSDRPPEIWIELAALEHHLLSVDGRHCLQWDEKIAGVFHVHQNHRLAVRRYLTDRAELLAAIREKRLVSE